ncbi:MAG: M28 family peptidase, partial [Vicinamibacteria bacterium]
MRIALLCLLIAHPVLSQISPDEREVLDALDAARVVELTRRLSRDVVTENSGAGYGTAVAGSAAEKALADVIEREMRDRGFDVARERFPVRGYDFGEARLLVDGREIEAITLHASTGTWGTRDGVEYRNGNAEGGKVVRAKLVDAGTGLASDYDRAGDVNGKVVIVRRTVWPSATALEAAVRGALAVLFYDYPGENPEDALKQDSIQYHDDIPAIAIARRDAIRILEKLSSNEAEVVIENRVDVGYGFSENVIGRAIGSGFPDEFTAVTAHHDRWHQGAQDDAIGVAVMLELGRVLKGAGPRRTLLLISFGAEEAGGIETQADWLTGSYAFVKQHPEISSRLAYAFNVDGAGFTAETGHLFATLDNLPFQRRLLEDLDLENRIQLHDGVTNWVDAWSLGAIGGGGVSYLLWFSGHPVYEGPSSFSRYYHTQLDLYRPEEYQNLDIDLDLGALGLLRVDRSRVLPIDLRELSSWATRTLEADARRAPSVSFEKALDAANTFHREAERVTREAAAVEGTGVERLNRALMNTRHRLVPWLLSGSSSGAVLKSTAYASELSNLVRAREAIELGDAAMAASALEEVATVDSGRAFSEGSYFRERVYAFGPGNWGNDFEQDFRPLSTEVFRLYQRVRGGSIRESDAAVVRELEAQTRGNLDRALLVISGKLSEAARSLAE